MLSSFHWAAFRVPAAFRVDSTDSFTSLPLSSNLMPIRPVKT